MIELDFAKSGGLLPVIVQAHDTKEVLMLAYLSPEAWEESLRTGRGVYYSRSRKKLWRKGEESGNIQRLRRVMIDCDRDTVLFQVEQVGGAACHTGHRSCFYSEIIDGRVVENGELCFDPEKVYAKK